MVPYVNTPQVVEDMVEIVERHGEWRQHVARLEIESDAGHSLDAENIRTIRGRTDWNKGNETLQYWGFSYGTILGQTFAAMHPERVNRMLIDGVVDPDDYYQGRWLESLRDSDKAMQKLCEYCFRAGPQKCPVYTGKSAEDIERRLVQILSDLKSNPVPAVGPNGCPVAVDFDDFYLKAIGAMAFPFAIAEDTFKAFAELAKGNVSVVAAEKEDVLEVVASLAHCRKSPDGCMLEKSFGLITSTPVIECLDSAINRPNPYTKGDFQSYYQELKAQSKWFSACWARHSMSCIGIDSKPAWTYDGIVSTYELLLGLDSLLCHRQVISLAIQPML